MKFTYFLMYSAQLAVKFSEICFQNLPNRGTKVNSNTYGYANMVLQEI